MSGQSLATAVTCSSCREKLLLWKSELGLVFVSMAGSFPEIKVWGVFSHSPRVSPGNRACVSMSSVCPGSPAVPRAAVCASCDTSAAIWICLSGVAPIYA